MDRKGSFRAVDDAANPDEFVAFLGAADRLPGIKAIKDQMLADLALQPGDHVLDVGCGLGDDVRRCASRVMPGGRSVGLDKSVSLLEEARRRGSPPGVELLQGDAYSLPFSDASFDACRAERLLLHLDEPGRALAEMARVLRPGGRLAVFDLDWQCLVVDHPDRKLTSAIVERIAGRRRDPWLGRALPRLVRQAGLGKVSATAWAILLDHSFFLGLRRDALAQVAADGIATTEALSRWELDLEIAAREGQFFASLTGFVVRGTVGV